MGITTTNMKNTMATGSGFTMAFANGLTISVGHGKGTYCDNRDGKRTNNWQTNTRTAEIAIWDEDNNWFHFGHDIVEGWLSADKIAIWISRVRMAESLDQLERYVDKEEE